MGWKSSKTEKKRGSRIAANSLLILVNEIAAE
jgi:hypothetical protein